MTTYCQACSMPMEKPEDFGNQNTSAKTCVHCTNPDGTVKPCAEIFEGGVQFFVQTTGVPRDMAEKVTRKNMLSLPLWQEEDEQVLQGPVASDEEFTAAMQQLG